VRIEEIEALHEYANLEVFLKKKRKEVDLSTLEGVITFFGSHHALKAEFVLKKNEIAAVIIPGPREISPNCGVAVRFDYARRDEAVKLFQEYFIHYEDIHHYPEK
jgi:hypothetical protein